MSQYERLIGEMNQQQVNAVLGVLERHVGRDAAIGRADLVRAVRARGVAVHERQAREIIKALRRLGYLICSAAGEDGGYYMAADSREFEGFVRTEYEGKIADMSETLSAMRKAARRQFGIATQGTLL